MSHNPPAEKRDRKSVVRTAFGVIHGRRLWRHYGKEGVEFVAAAVKHDHGPLAKVSVSYFQWLKSRYLAQRMLGLPLDRLVKLSAADKAKLRVLRSQLRASF